MTLFSSNTVNPEGLVWKFIRVNPEGVPVGVSGRGAVRYLQRQTKHDFRQKQGEQQHPVFTHESKWALPLYRRARSLDSDGKRAR